VSAARHVHRLDARERNPLAIVNTVLAVVAATTWLIALPTARDEPSPRRSPAVLPLIHEDISGGKGTGALMPASVFDK
jgi:hypothetical protein